MAFCSIARVPSQDISFERTMSQLTEPPKSTQPHKAFVSHHSQTSQIPGTSRSWQGHRVLLNNRYRLHDQWWLLYIIDWSNFVWNLRALQLRKVWHQSNRSLQLVAGIRNRLEQRQSYEMIQLSKSKVVSDYHKKSAHTSAILYWPSWHPSSIVFFLPLPVCPSLLLASYLPSLLSLSVFSPSCSSFPGQNNFDNFDLVEHAFK